MNKKEIFQVIGDLDDDLILDAAKPFTKKVISARWIKLVPVAACLVLFLGLGFAGSEAGKDIELKRSSGNISAKYIKQAPSVRTSADLIWLTEEELFSRYETAIFKGTIKEMQNIVVDFNGTKEYFAIAQISVNKLYRGNLSVGKTVSVLLPCPIATNLWVEDTETVSAMKEGMTGIFMPMLYDEFDYREEHGATLYLKDIADYGFADGARYAFLESEDGLIFAREAYESIATINTLEEVEEYIEQMIN